MELIKELRESEESKLPSNTKLILPQQLQG